MTPDQRIAMERAVMVRAKPHDVLDVGANVGDMTKMFLELGAERVVCVEPIPDIFERLTATFANDPRVQTLKLAVTDEANLEAHSGQLKNQSVFNCYTLRPSGLDAALRASGAPSLESSPEYRHRDAFDVQLSTIDRIVADCDLKPEFIKIDVDGYEAKAMRGAQETIRNFRPVIMLEISYLPKFFDDSCEGMIVAAFEGGYVMESMFDGRMYNTVAEFMPVFPWNTSFDVILWPSGHPGKP